MLYGWQDHSTEFYREHLALMYRRIQIFVILCDQCFQMYFWPTVCFSGALLIIGLLYTFIITQQVMPLMGAVVIFVMIVSAALLSCLMFHMGSRPMLVSRSVLRRVTYFNRYKLSKRVLKSCPMISLKIGRFHRMDRERGPAFIRFILQRTFFFVLKTKLSVNSGGIMVISIPVFPNNY